MSQVKLLTEKEFLELKQKIDDEVARLGWGKAFCKRYIKYHYGKQSRLSMTDDQIVHLLNTLARLNQPQFRRKRRRRRKRI